MIILPISFKENLCWPAGRGQIAITAPAGTINFTRAQIRQADALAHPNAVQHTLAGKWAGFPEWGVRHLEVIAHTDKDYKWFTIPVNGAAQGNFSGDIFIWPANKVTPVRIDGFDLMAGQPMFSTGYFEVAAQLVGEPPEDTGPLVAFPDDFIARISKVVRGWQKGELIPVNVWFDVQKAPPGTNSLELYFLIDGLETRQRIKTFNGPDEFSFDGQLPADHPGVVGLQNGKVGTGCILKATRTGEVLGAIRTAFDLDRAEHPLF